MKKLLILMLVILLTGCTSTTKKMTPSTVNTAPTGNYYLNLANNSTGAAQQQYRLQAVNAYWQSNDAVNANKAFTQINATLLDDVARNQYTIFSFKSALYDNNPNNLATAQTQITALLANTTLTPDQRGQTFLLQAELAQKQNNSLTAVQARIQATPLLTDETTNQHNQRAIWQLMNQMPITTLNTLNENPDLILQGWATLAIVYQQNMNQPVTLLSQLRQWQQQHPHHPANLLLTADIAHLENLLRVPKQLAIILPLQGLLAEQGNAVLNGILIAYYDARSKNLPTPTLRVYDDSNHNIETLYQQAVTDGAEFIIGPLTKSNVALLKDKTNMTVPTLTLNYSVSDTVNSPLYEFALSPENDAKAAAMRATTRPGLHAITITPSGQWGKNIVDAFAQTWAAHNGTIVNSLTYGPNENLTNAVASILNINESNQRELQLQKTLGHKLKFSPRRRQDIDVIFMNAFPPAAAEITPLLRFYYAGNIPVFATAVIYSGTENAARDKDLNGIQFTISPWAIAPSPQARVFQRDASHLWSNNFKQYNSFYAFGIDAYTLMLQLYHHATFPVTGITGNTGQLLLQDNHKIYTQLLWAQFQNGLPVLVK